MKIIQFTPYFPPHKGGLQVVAENISKYLTKGNHCEVINVTSSIGQEEIIESDIKKVSYKNTILGYWIHGYQVLVLPSFELIHNFPVGKFWSKKFRKIIYYIKAENPDVIQTHTRFFLQTFFGGIIAKWLKKPRVHIEHGSGFVTGIAKRKQIAARVYDEILGRLVFKLCDKIVSINKTNLHFIQKFVSLKKCETIYNGIEIPNIPARTHNDSAVVKLVWAGRLIRLKGVDLLLQACKNLVDRGVANFFLDIVGDGDEKVKLEEQMEKLQLQNYIKFHGSRNHDEIITDFIPKADILVNPSHQEGLPTTVLEGLLGGCVVVATDVGGTKEISDKSDLILLPAGNSELLADKLQYAIKNYKKLRGQSEGLIKERFNWENSAKEYAEVYEKL